MGEGETRSTAAILAQGGRSAGGGEVGVGAESSPDTN
jgi:hypothetical protein